MARTITITTTKRARERQKIEMEKQVHFGHCAYAALTAMELNMRNYLYVCLVNN